MHSIDANNFTENLPEFSVSDLSVLIKKKIEGEFPYIKVRGEIGRVSQPASGHTYLDFKDEKSVLAGIIWKGTLSKLNTKPEEGMEVIVIGKLTTFSGQSRYQIIVEELKPAGMGALMLTLDRRKKKLEAEGLFLEKHKRALPFLPETIGVITSVSGVVIKDILHRLRDRFPRQVLIWSVTVQGDRCAPEVILAIEGFNRMDSKNNIAKPDLLIIARGGGSIEDLWGFNEENVVRAVRNSDIPIISAIGHETDVTLIDFASDKRAPTPTAAAEMAVPVREQLIANLISTDTRLTRQLINIFNVKVSKINELIRVMPKVENLIADQNQYIDLLSTKLEKAISGFITHKTLQYSKSGAEKLQTMVLSNDLKRRNDDINRLSSRAIFAIKIILSNYENKLMEFERLLNNLSYKNTLKRGYAIVRDLNQTILYNADETARADSFIVEFDKGKLHAKVKDMSKI